MARGANEPSSRRRTIRPTLLASSSQAASRMRRSTGFQIEPGGHGPADLQQIFALTYTIIGEHGLIGCA